MREIVHKVIGEAVREDETRTYTVTARSDHLDELEKFFSWINSTRAGHSGAATLYVDGDGAARIEIEPKEGELKKPDEDDIHTGGRDAEYKVCLESLFSGKLKKPKRPAKAPPAKAYTVGDTTAFGGVG